MKNTDYAFAVANVRAKETELYPYSFMDSLLNTDSYDALKQILADKGFDDELMLGDYMEQTWEYLMDISPDGEALHFLILKNDFHNLKSIIKGIVSGTDGRMYCIKPCIIDKEEMYESIKTKNYDTLPSWIRVAAKQSYELLTTTMDGQLFDMYLDCESLAKMYDFAKVVDNQYALTFVENYIALANIRVAVRLSKNAKSDLLIDYAFCDCALIDAEELKRAVKKGRSEVIEYISQTDFSKLSEYINYSSECFERECDNYLLNTLEDSKYISFGIEPLIAYYYARETEWKNLRIIISGKKVDLPSDSVRERMRELYV